MTIGELCNQGLAELQTGPFGTQLHAHDYVDEGVPVVPTSAIGRRLLIEDDLPRISRAKAEELERHKLEAGDILFARRGVQATGLSAIVQPHQRGWLCGTGAIRLRLDQTAVSPEYLSFVLSANDSYMWLRQHAIGATMPNLNEGVIQRFPLRLPSVDEQRRITAILGVLDEKIQLNRRMNRTLEEIAQALFRSWFVDFNGQTDLVESGAELGVVPRGWEVGPPSRLIGFDPKESLSRGTVARYLGMSEVSTDSSAVGGVEERPYNGGSRFRLGDTLLARITPCLENGKTALVDFLDPGEVGFGSTEFIVMRGRAGVPKEFVYCLARSDHFRRFAIAHMSGSSGRQRVNRGSFKHFRMALPDAASLQRFGATVSPLFMKVTANHTQSRTLAALRDTLLPKLISGEIRVPEAERAVENAV